MNTKPLPRAKQIEMLKEPSAVLTANSDIRNEGKMLELTRNLSDHLSLFDSAAPRRGERGRDDQRMEDSLCLSLTKRGLSGMRVCGRVQPSLCICNLIDKEQTSGHSVPQVPRERLHKAQANKT